ncbi:hypothetical protein RQP46_010006 [Phenoliferia psychrophenolica]
MEAPTNLHLHQPFGPRPHLMEPKPVMAKKPPSREAHRCDLCDKTFSRKEYAMRHHRRKHPSVEGEAAQIHPVKTALPSPPKSPTDVRSPLPKTAPSPPLSTNLPSTTTTATAIPTVRPPNIQGRLPSYRPQPQAAKAVDVVRDGGKPDVKPRICELDGEGASIAPADPLLPRVGTSNKRRFEEIPEMALQPCHPRRSTSPPASSWNLLTPPVEDLSAHQQFYSYPISPELGFLFDNNATSPDPPVVHRSPSLIEGSASSSWTEQTFDLRANIRASIGYGSTLEWQEVDSIEHITDVPGHPAVQNVEHRHSRFFPYNQTFCIGIRDPASIPSLPRLSRWASLSILYLSPTLPIVHRGTLFEGPMVPAPLAFALSVSGAGFEQGGRHFHEDLTLAKREFAIDYLDQLEFTYEEQVAAFQAFIIYNTCSLHVRSPADDVMTARSHATLVRALRAANYATAVRQAQWDIPHHRLEVDAATLYSEWSSWAKSETLKRITMFIVLLDLTISNEHGTPSLIDLATIDFDFPAPDALWQATTPEAWRIQYYTDNRRPLPFIGTLEVLLSLGFPLPDSPQAATLSRIPALASTSLSLLAQALRYLKREVMKTAASSSVPRRVTKGLPPSIMWDPPDLALRKIDNALRLLTVSGGPDPAVPWFRPIQPIFR